jgi:hypothetical protein
VFVKTECAECVNVSFGRSASFRKTIISFRLYYYYHYYAAAAAASNAELYKEGLSFQNTVF